MRWISSLLLVPLVLACGDSPEGSSATRGGGIRSDPPGATPEARADTTPPRPLQASDEALRFFAGRWLATARDPGTGRSFTLRYEVTPVLGGAWLSGAGESPELGIQVRDMWGRDPATGEIVRVIFQGDGTHGTVRSPGWRGDTLRFEGEVQAGDGVQRVRETITRLGPDEFDALWEAMIDGSWTPYSDEHLVRQPGS